MVEERRQDLIPPTRLQKLWVAEYAPSRFRALHLMSTIRCNALLDTDVLRRAVARVVNRHHILRTVVARDSDGAIRLQVTDRQDADLCELNFGNQDVHDVADGFRMMPFDLEEGPLYRVGVGRTPDGRTLCVVVMHHIIADGLSLGIFWSEVVRNCNQDTNSRDAVVNRPLPLHQYTDVLLQQDDWLRSHAAARARDYWKRRIEASRNPVMLSTRRSSSSGGMRPPISGQLDAAGSKNLVDAAKLTGVPFSSAILAAFALLLKTCGSGTDVLAWVYHSGRLRKDTMKSIGNFMDMWLLSVSVDSARPLPLLMTDVHSAVVEGLSARSLPGFEIADLLADVHANLRPMGAFNFLPTQSARSVQVEGGSTLVAEAVKHPRQERYMRAMTSRAMFLTVRWDQSVLEWEFTFDPEYFEDSCVDAASATFFSILQQMGEHRDGTGPLRGL